MRVAALVFIAGCAIEHQSHHVPDGGTTDGASPDGASPDWPETSGDCFSPLPCPQPTETSKLSICGWLYDFEDGKKFMGDATGARCDPFMPTSGGPCALSVFAFDVISYGMSQTQGNITPTSSNDIYIDDCGRFRVTNIVTNGTGPFIGIGFTEAGKLPQRPLANLTVTATTAVATTKLSSRVVDRVEAWIAKPSMIESWQNSGGPPLSGGIYVGSFRAHTLGNGDRFAPQSGVTFTKPSTNTGDDYYFTASQTTNTTIDASKFATGVNGTGLLTGASVNDTVAYSAQGGITSAHCRWEPHVAANLANIVFFQIFRKGDVPLDSTPCSE